VARPGRGTGRRLGQVDRDRVVTELADTLASLAVFVVPTGSRSAG